MSHHIEPRKVAREIAREVARQHVIDYHPYRFQPLGTPSAGGSTDVGGTGGSSLVIKEEDGSPVAVDVNTLLVPNDSLVDNGDGTFTLTLGGGGGGGSHDHMGTGSNSTIVYGLTDGTAAVASADKAIAGGDGAAATAAIATALGAFAQATGTYSIAIGGGDNATISARANYPHAIAMGVNAVSDSGIAIGDSAHSYSLNGIALGVSTEASTGAGDQGIAIGGNAIAGPDSDSPLAVGYIAEASGDYAVAIGRAAIASHNYSSAIGSGATTTATHQVRIGTSAERMMSPAPSSAPTDADIGTGFITLWLDESGNNLKVRVRYSGGTYKTATVALV